MCTTSGTFQTIQSTVILVRRKLLDNEWYKSVRGDMKRLLAVAVKGSWESEWQTAQGNEQAVIAHPIGKGELVWLEAEASDEGVTVLRKFLLSADPTVLNYLKLTRY